MTSLEQRYQKSPDVVSREILGETILVPIRNNVGDLESIYTLNETAALAWSLMDGNRTTAEICDALLQEYDVAPENVHQDIVELLTALEEIGAVAKV